MSDTNPWIHRECEKCGYKQRTRAKKRWYCNKCGHWNYVTHTPHQKPYKAPKVKRFGLDKIFKEKRGGA